jgi:hypothetical protein
MKTVKFTGRLFIWGVLFLPFIGRGQKFKPDTSYIKIFEKNNVAELYTGDYSTHFNFSDPRSFKSNFKLVANSSGYMGAYLNYKWASLKYSFAIPGTELDRDTKFKYMSLRYRFSGRRKILHLFYDTYNGFLIPVGNIKDSFRVFEDIRFRNTGFDFYYFFNARKFSYYAANNFSERQIRSAGSLLIMITPMLNKISWKNPSTDLITDSLTYEILSKNPEWFSFVSRAGYTYNFTWKQGKWSIVPTLLLGVGLRKELNINKNGIQLVSDIRTLVNAGYNGNNFYCYLTAKWGNLQTNLLIKNMHQVDQNISITAGYRFHSLKKKILGIL